LGVFRGGRRLRPLRRRVRHRERRGRPPARSRRAPLARTRRAPHRDRAGQSPAVGRRRRAGRALLPPARDRPAAAVRGAVRRRRCAAQALGRSAPWRARRALRRHWPALSLDFGLPRRGADPLRLSAAFVPVVLATTLLSLRAPNANSASKSASVSAFPSGVSPKSRLTAGVPPVC